MSSSTACTTCYYSFLPSLIHARFSQGCLTGTFEPVPHKRPHPLASAPPSAIAHCLQCLERLLAVTSEPRLRTPKSKPTACVIPTVLQEQTQGHQPLGQYGETLPPLRTVPQLTSLSNSPGVLEPRASSTLQSRMPRETSQGSWSESDTPGLGSKPNCKPKITNC